MTTVLQGSREEEVAYQTTQLRPEEVEQQVDLANNIQQLNLSGDLQQTQTEDPAQQQIEVPDDIDASKQREQSQDEGINGTDTITDTQIVDDDNASDRQPKQDIQPDHYKVDEDSEKTTHVEDCENGIAGEYQDQSSAQQIQTLEQSEGDIPRHKSTGSGSGLSQASDNSGGNRYHHVNKGYNRRGRGYRYSNNNSNMRRQGRKNNSQNNYNGGGGGYSPQMYGYNPSPLYFPPGAQRFPSEGFQKGEVIRQVEYYLSSENLVSDIYLRKHMDDEGWVPIATIASFRRMTRLCPFGIGQIIDALKDSKKLELGRHNLVIRSLQRHEGFILPKEQRKTEVFEEVDRLEQEIIGSMQQQQQQQFSMATMPQQLPLVSQPQPPPMMQPPPHLPTPTATPTPPPPSMPPPPPLAPFPLPNMMMGLPQYQMNQFNNYMFPMQPIQPQGVQAPFQNFPVPPQNVPPSNVPLHQGQQQSQQQVPQQQQFQQQQQQQQQAEQTLPAQSIPGIQENELFALDSSRSNGNGTGTGMWIKQSKVEEQ